jgi:protocatechuate 3,4-dioxygenase, beta subunit
MPVRVHSRRELLSLAVSLGSIGAVTSGLVRAATPNLTPGPFYPTMKPLDQDADLTRITGGTGRAEGELLHITGRILDESGAPISGATVEIWQADSHGRYAHRYDRNPAAIDRNFQGYGVQRSDEQGRYRFKTVKPAAYPGGFGMRTPHVHFQVSTPAERKITQMFFPDETLNDTDSVLKGVKGDRSLLFARLGPPANGLDADSMLASFDVFLARG